MSRQPLNGGLLSFHGTPYPGRMRKKKGLRFRVMQAGEEGYSGREQKILQPLVDFSTDRRWDSWVKQVEAAV